MSPGKKTDTSVFGWLDLADGRTGFSHSRCFSWKTDYPTNLYDFAAPSWVTLGIPNSSYTFKSKFLTTDLCVMLLRFE